MTTVIGSRMVNGAGLKYHTASGEGLVRKVASTVLRHIGHKAVDAAANVVGGGYKITGEGRKRKVGRPTTANAKAYKKRHAHKPAKPKTHHKKKR